MSAHEPRDPGFEAKVKDSFARQPLMATLGARLTRVEPGHVTIELDRRDEITQQHGYVHAGAVGSIMDSAGGYAAFSLFPPGSSVLSVEYKLNLLAPAAGARIVAEGRVVRSGRTLSVCDLEAWSVEGDERTLCARGQQTVICLHATDDRPPG